MFQSTNLQHCNRSVVLYIVLAKMNLYDIKEVLKPEKSKGLVFILFIPLAYIWYVSGTGHSLLVGFLFVFLFLPLIGLDLFDISNQHDGSSYAFIRLIGFVLSIIYWYVLACLIVYLLKKTKAKKK
jgi:hypothetical protein